MRFTEAEDLLAEFPDLECDDLRACLEFAVQFLKVKITFRDILMGCVTGQAFRIHVRFARPAVAAFACGNSRPLGDVTKVA
jgi:hypothetical protein